MGHNHHHDHDGASEPQPEDGLIDEIWLTALTWVGLAVASVDAFWLPLPGAAVRIALMLAFLAGGLPAAARALTELVRDRRLDIDLLMVIAALAAAAVGAALEGVVLLALFSLSGTLEHRAMGRARRAVEALMALRPETALLLIEGETREVPVKDLVPGDQVVLRPGARVPVDGRISQGEGAVDESTITGESAPVNKVPGAKAHEATVNLNAVLVMEVTRGLNESTVAQMIALVTQAQAMKAPAERFSEWFGQRYTVAVLLGSVVAFGVLLWLGRDMQDALYRAATLLVAASPCAVVISVPAAILSALSAAARGGVLFKGGGALETLAKVEIFAFDKTGTLTTGQTGVSALAVLNGDEAGFLALLAGMESQSEHPVAAAIRREVAGRGLTPVAVVGVTASPGEGLLAKGDLWVGNPRLAARMGASLAHAAVATLAGGDETVIYMGRGNEVLGALAMSDQPRATARAGLVALRLAGVREIVLLTGDRKAVADRVGAALGFGAGEIHADLLPEDKVRLVGSLAQKGRVAFVGDGVNDAAALARADVGIAMGAAGSEVALQAAEVALLSDDLARLAAAHRLARRMVRIIRQNLIFALGAMVVLVVGGLFFELPLPLAVIGHEGGTLLVVMNGLRLLFDPIRADRRA